MARTRKRIDIAGLKIEEPIEISLITVEIRRAINRNKLFLRGYAESGPMVAFRLSEARPAPVVSENYGTLVVRFFDVAEWRYWLGLQVKFRTIMGETQFQSASLTILRSALATEEKSPVFRAEWEVWEEAEHRRHAQPHWHIYVAEVNAGQRSGADLAVMKRFHWPMASGWHQGEPETHYRIPSARGVAGWIRECVLYSRRELEWLSRKM